jgi:hypothetical protein
MSLAAGLGPLPVRGAIMFKAIPAALLAFGLISAAHASANAVAQTMPAKPSGVIAGAVANDQASAVYDAPPPPAGPKITSNFAKYTKGRYNCCFGFQVSGGVSSHQWLAVPFTPATNTTVKTISVALGYRSGTNKAVITLNSDSGGVPGTTLGTFAVSGLPNFGATGTCCVITTVTSAGGIAVTGGHTYWVVVKTDSLSTTFVGVWNGNVINQTGNQSGALNQTGSWATTSFKPGLAFSVYGP